MSDEDRAQISLAQNAYQQIEEMIVTRALKPGVMISERQLADLVGCGRTPVREAIQRLSLEGYIEIHPSRGIQVSPVDIVRLFEVLEVRRPLEDLMVRLAAERATRDEREKMTKLSELFLKAAKKQDVKPYLRANRSIHETIAKATHNRVLIINLGVVHGLSRRFFYTRMEEENVLEEAAKLHSRTLACIVAKDVPGAARHAGNFLDFLDRLTRKRLNERISGVEV